MFRNDKELTSAFGRRTVESVTKLVFAAGSILLLAYLVSLLPGIERVVPGTEVAIMDLVRVVAAFLVAGALLYAASGLAGMTALVLGEPPDLVEHVASIVHWLVVLAAVLIAHWGAAPLVVGLAGGGGWLVDLAFLLLAAGPVILIAARLYAMMDPMADHVADRMTE